MKWFNILRDRLRALRQRETVITDIDREMRAHLDLQIEENIRVGMSPEKAREKAMQSFGNVNRAVDAAYDVGWRCVRNAVAGHSLRRAHAR